MRYTGLDRKADGLECRCAQPFKPSTASAIGALRKPNTKAAVTWAAGSARLCIPGEIAMLILTRRIGETIMVGEDVTVTVLGVKGSQVRVGISAPKTVEVHREEIYERIKAERATGETMP